MQPLHPKVAASTLGAFLAACATIAMVSILQLHGVKMDNDVSGLLTAVSGALSAFLSGYYAPSPSMKGPTIMANINFTQALKFVGEIIVEEQADIAALEAGQSVALRKIQIGMLNGKPLFLEANLSTS